MASPIRISPGAPACSSRAATLIASPSTGDRPEATTSPVFTPIRTAARRLTQPAAAYSTAPPQPPSRSQKRPQSVVLVGGRHTEHAHQAIAHQVPRLATVTLGHPLDLGREASQHTPQRLRVKPLAQRRRTNHIDKHDRNDASRLMILRRYRVERRPAGQAELALSGFSSLQTTQLYRARQVYARPHRPVGDGLDHDRSPPDRAATLEGSATSQSAGMHAGRARTAPMLPGLQGIDQPPCATHRIGVCRIRWSSERAWLSRKMELSGFEPLRLTEAFSVPGYGLASS